MAKKKEEKRVMSEEEKKEVGLAALGSARAHITAACDKAGLTVEEVAKTVVNAMKAKKVIAQLDFKTGVFIYSKEMEDHAVQLKAVERAEDLLDLRPTEKHTVNVIDSMGDEELDNRLAKLMEKKK